MKNPVLPGLVLHNLPAGRQESRYVPDVEIFISRIMYFSSIYVRKIKSIHQSVYVHYLWKTPLLKRGRLTYNFELITY